MTETESRRFVKSTWSGGDGGNCVEWAFDPAGVYVRDSKDRFGAELLFTFSEWQNLAANAASGAAHDSIYPRQYGVHLTGPGGELFFTHAEWNAFTAGARAGECSPTSYAVR